MYQELAFIYLYYSITKIFIYLCKSCIIFATHIRKKLYVTMMWLELMIFFSFQLYACLMIFFISNAIEGQLISTGAFEVSFNGEALIFNASIFSLVCIQIYKCMILDLLMFFARCSTYYQLTFSKNFFLYNF